MFSSVAFNVVIGLVFIYLLYSLLATILSEIIATILGLRARNLKEAIDRMLNIEKTKGFWKRLWDSLRLMKNPDNKAVNSFYDQPEIKYLGSSGIFKNPSWFKAGSFSKSIMHLLFGTNTPDKKSVESRLDEISAIAVGDDEEVKKNIILDKETTEYIKSIWQDAQGDIAKFKIGLEDWFDRTMEQATEWYKRKIRIVLIVLGFCMAWFFYADTFMIIHNLSVDKDAREQLVNLASAYVQNNQISFDTTAINNAAGLSGFNERLDSLLSIKKQLEDDMANSENILGVGGWLPDTVIVSTDPKTKVKSYSPEIDPESLSPQDRQQSNGKISFTCLEKFLYMLRLAYHHFFGFLITAIAISLGAPFWFDLLNKMMQLRSASKTNSTGTAPPNNASPRPEVVSTDTKPGNEGKA